MTARIAVFIDGKYFHANQVDRYLDRIGVRSIDLRQFGLWLTSEAGGANAALAYQGYYTGVDRNPRTPWLLARLSQVESLYGVKPRTAIRGDFPLRCVNYYCRSERIVCRDCRRAYSRSTEKEIDTMIVCDMLELAWNDKYDTAVIITGDRDFRPAAQLVTKEQAAGGPGKQIVLAAWNPSGKGVSSELAKSACAVVDLTTMPETCLVSPTDQNCDAFLRELGTAELRHHPEPTLAHNFLCNWPESEGLPLDLFLRQRVLAILLDSQEVVIGGTPGNLTIATAAT